MLAEGRPIYGYAPRGYWCDMGDCRAYLRCLSDALDGKVDLDLGLPSGLSRDLGRRPPFRILWWRSRPAGSAPAPRWATGPSSAPTVLGAGSTVGRKALVQASVLLGAAVDAHATLYSSILCPDALAGRGSVLNDWRGPGRRAPSSGGTPFCGTASRSGQASGSPTEHGSTPPSPPAPAPDRSASPTAGSSGGALELDLTPETLLTLGLLLGAEGKVGMGARRRRSRPHARPRPPPAASPRREGRRSVTTPRFPAAAGWLAHHFTLPVSLFVEQRGERITLYLFDRRGLPLGRARERKLESALLRHEIRRSQPAAWAPGTDLGVTAAYAGAAASQAGRRLAAPVHRGPRRRTGGRTHSPPRWPSWAAPFSAGGRRPPCIPATADRCFASDETDARCRPCLLTLLCLLELEEGARAVSSGAGDRRAAHPIPRRLCPPAGPDGRGRPGPVQRAGLSPGRGLRRLPAVRPDGTDRRDAGRAGPQAPAFAVERREVPLRGDRAALMQALSRRFPEAEGLEDGLRIRTEQG